MNQLFGLVLQTVSGLCSAPQIQTLGDDSCPELLPLQVISYLQHCLLQLVYHSQDPVYREDSPLFLVSLFFSVSVYLGL